jgi:hypothetical protein
MSMSDHRLHLPEDFDAYGWQAEAKGWFSDARLSAFGKEYQLNFYDPVRLAQEIASEHERDTVFCEPNLVVVKEVTRSAMEEAAHELVRSGRISSLVAM